MNATTIIRFCLAISLIILLLAIALQSDGTAFLSTPAAFAQDASPTRQPLPSSKSAPQNSTQNNPKANLVSLQVLVSDAKGNAVNGLKRENFTIYEDNVKQEILNFSPIDASLTVAMLVEYSNNISYFVNQVWNAMRVFIDGLRREDYAAVVGYNIKPTILCDFTENRQELYSTLIRFRHPSFDESNLSDALIDILDRTQDIEGKAAILLISTGLDTMSKHKFDQALEKCKTANASVYAVGLNQTFRIFAEPRGALSSQMSMDLFVGESRLKSIAEHSGGAAYFPRSETEFPGIFNKISELLRNQYSIAYSSANTRKDGTFRKIHVEAIADLHDDKGKPLKLKVSTRKGYTAKKEKPGARSQEPE